jgi:hypothetical protein
VSSSGVPAGSGGGLSAFANSFELSPIIFVGGIASGSSGGQLPISQLLQAGNWPSGPLGASAGLDPANFFAHFYPFNGQLAVNEIAHWPMANLVVAANDQISQPLTINLLMMVPGNPESGVTYDGKQAVMTALQNSLAQHLAQGGYFNVATPSYLYQGCLLKALREVGPGSPDGGQAQVEWVWEFEQPLITLAAAQGAQNTAMARITGQTINTGNPPATPVQTGVGAPTSNLTGSLIPGAAGLAGVTANRSPIGAPAPPLTAVSPIPPGS